MLPISVQLYSLRSMMQEGYEKEDFLQVLKWVAAVGYKGVEPAGLFGYTPKEFKAITDDLGLQISSAHSPWFRNLDQTQQMIDDLGAMGLKTACCGWGPNEYKDLDAIKKTAELYNQMQAAMEKAGITLFAHNHAWEFAKVDGRLAYDIFVELAPKAKFELDVYWSANFGANDPAAMVTKFRDRTILLHLKDGTQAKDINMLPLGSGKMDIPKIIGALDPNICKWIIVELDNCCIDMNVAIKKSYRYMVSNGLAAGNK